MVCCFAFNLVCLFVSNVVIVCIQVMIWLLPTCFVLWFGLFVLFVVCGCLVVFLRLVVVRCSCLLIMLVFGWVGHLLVCLIC